MVFLLQHPESTKTGCKWQEPPALVSATSARGLVNLAMAQKEVCNLVSIDAHVKVLVNDSKTPTRFTFLFTKGFTHESPGVFLPIIIIL